MTENQIIILSVSIGMFLIQGLFTAISYWLCVDTRFRHFYITPVIAITRTMANDYRFKKWETIVFTICYYIIVTSLIIPIWFIAWCLYKFWEFIYVDDTQEQKSTEDVTGMDFVDVDKDYDLKVEKYSREMEEALNNPEAMPKIDNNDYIYKSEEFLQYIKDNSKENEEENN